MKPITIACTESLSRPAVEIAASILSLANWLDFKGYGFLPGIKTAVFERQTPEIVGTRIRVTNTDGSSHVEEIVEWNPEHSVRLGLDEFSPPLSRLATKFIESWAFRQAEGETTVTRSFELYPKSLLARPALWLISALLKQAITRHLRQMRHLEKTMQNKVTP
jgi:hypothetical protein